jgi:tetratricopeptide (TPR) repeat protein
MILNMKFILHTTVCSLVWVGVILTTPIATTFGVDVQPVKPALQKISAEEQKKEEQKKDPSSTKTKDPAQQEQIAKLIEQLGDKDYYVRQNAQNELARLGFEAFDALTIATTNDDLEIASRAKYILRMMRVEWTAKNDPDDIKKLLKDYELQPDDLRLDRIQALAQMPEGKGLLALCRLIRFEKSEQLSKMAMVKLLQSPSGSEPPKGARAETIQKLFEKSNRTSAAWMIVWLQQADDAKTLARWNKLIDDESSLLRQASGDTSREIVVGLIRYQITRLKKQGQTEQVMTAMRRLVDLENGDLDSLAELVGWLMEQKAWKMIDELAVRFAPRFNTEPNLLYVVAQAQKEQGDVDKSEATAKRAFQLNTGNDELKLFHRLSIAQRLNKEGLFDWANREFTYIISQGGPSSMMTINAQWNLSEMLHEQSDDLAASKVLEGLLKSSDSKTNPGNAGRIASALQQFFLSRKKANDTKFVEQAVSEIRARVLFLQACHWQREGDQAKRRECLENALKLNPGDIDVLIACYRLPDQTPEYQKSVKDLIRKAADNLRGEIAAEPDNPSSYNQLAWLIANTEGDFDEALKCSQKSLDLSPESGGLYDTLGRVYYAKGDFDNALKYQQKAAELEPHSGLIAKQLELFKKAKEESKKKD